MVNVFVIVTYNNDLDASCGVVSTAASLSGSTGVHGAAISILFYKLSVICVKDAKCLCCRGDEKA
jgi:hypothetical protein